MKSERDGFRLLKGAKSTEDNEELCETTLLSLKHVKFLQSSEVELQGRP